MTDQANQLHSGLVPNEHLGRLPTKYVPNSNLLLNVVRELLGSDFRIEMRHNVYNIRSQKEIDLGAIVESCNAYTTSSRPRTAEDSIALVQHVSIPQIQS